MNLNLATLEYLREHNFTIKELEEFESIIAELPEETYLHKDAVLTTIKFEIENIRDRDTWL